MELPHGKQYIVPLNATVSDNTKPMLLLTPAAKQRIRVVQMAFTVDRTVADITNTDGATITAKRIKTAAGTTLTATAVVVANPSGSTAPRFLAKKVVSAITSTDLEASAHVFGPYPAAPSTAAPIPIGPPHHIEAWGGPVGKIMTFTGAANTGWQGTLTMADGTAHIFEVGSGTETATLHYFSAGADATASAANLAAEISSVFPGSPAGAIAADTGVLTLDFNLGRGRVATAFVDTTDPGTDSSVADLATHHLAFYSSENATFTGWLVVEEYGGIQAV